MGAFDKIKSGLPGMDELFPSSESVESLFDKDVPPSFVQSSAGGRISV